MADSTPLKLQQTGPESGKVMFFIHGWPDDHRVWDLQVQHFAKKGYRCVAVTLPRFAPSATQGFDPWGYNFDGLVRKLAKSVRSVSNDKKVTLVIHDWGSYLGFYLQNSYPELIERIVAFDIGPPIIQRPKIKNIPLMVILGVIYQYWLILAFLLARCVPFVGQTLGDRLCNFMVARLKRGANKKPLPINPSGMSFSADCCYLYLYFHLNFILELVGIRRVFGNPTKPHATPSCPTLFMYGGKGRMGKMWKYWTAELVKRDDCKVVRADTTGHWVMLEDEPLVNREMEEFLSK